MVKIYPEAYCDIVRTLSFIPNIISYYVGITDVATIKMRFTQINSISTKVCDFSDRKESRVDQS